MTKDKDYEAGLVRIFTFRPQKTKRPDLATPPLQFSLMESFYLNSDARFPSVEVQEEIAARMGGRHWFRAHVPYLVLCRGMSFTVNYD